MSNIPLALSRPWSCVAQWGGGLRQLRNKVLFALQVHNERRTLMDLDARALADLGFSRDAARGESRRALWDLPHDRTWG
jgi:uncharacterized protein YjiS (DUF1127 family)